MVLSLGFSALAWQLQLVQQSQSALLTAPGPLSVCLNAQFQLRIPVQISNFLPTTSISKSNQPSALNVSAVSSSYFPISISTSIFLLAFLFQDWSGLFWKTIPDSAPLLPKKWILSSEFPGHFLGAPHVAWGMPLYYILYTCELLDW